jgi:hypothetical protein
MTSSRKRGGSLPPYHRPMRYTKEQWGQIGQFRINPLDAGDMEKLALLLHTSEKRIREAMSAVGTRIVDIRKYVEENRSK